MKRHGTEPPQFQLKMGLTPFVCFVFYRIDHLYTYPFFALNKDLNLWEENHLTLTKVTYSLRHKNT